MPHCPCDHSSSSSPGRPWSCHVSVALTIPRLPAGRAKSSVSPSSQTTTAGCPWTLQAPRRRVKCCVSRPHCRAHMFDMLHAVRRLNGRGKVATEQEEHQHRSLATNNTPQRFTQYRGSKVHRSTRLTTSRSASLVVMLGTSGCNCALILHTCQPVHTQPNHPCPQLPAYCWINALHRAAALARRGAGWRSCFAADIPRRSDPALRDKE